MKPDEKHLICPFVEVSFKNVDGDESAPVRTASSAALNTELININEALKIPLSTKGVEMTPQILSAHTSIIFFNVYDEVEIASQPDDRAHDVLTRKERRYLGSFELPFGTVYDNSKPIKGEFMVELPQIMYGYDHPSLLPTSDGEPMYIRLSVALEPQLMKQDAPPPKTVEGYESKPLLKHIKAWQDKHKARNPTAVGTDIDGHSILVCRFMAPLSPPPDVATLDQYGNCTDPHAIEKVAQFVSMLPFLRDSDLFENMNVTDLWLNSQEFVNFGYSDWEEHAILLANYFLAIDEYRKNNIETYCLIGEAIPEGDTVFVLRKCKDPEEGSKTPAFEIWNPDTGVSWHSPYKKKDVAPDPTKSSIFSTMSKDKRPLKESYNCPLKKVWCAFNQTNVWVCLQTQPKPDDSALMLSYAFENSKHWAPLFAESDYETYFKATDGKVLPLITKIDYPVVDQKSAEALQEELLMFIENKFIEERAKGTHGRPPMRANVMRGDMYVHLKGALERLEILRTSQRKGDVPDFPLHCVTATGGIAGAGIGASASFAAPGGSFGAAAKSSGMGAYESELYAIQQQVYNKTGGRRMYGVPIHMQYSGNEELWERVENTSILSLGEEDCEFFFAVRAFKYSSQVTSLWVFALAVGLST